MNRILIFSILILSVMDICSQTFVLNDSLSGNKTQYVHLHDSIYRFVSTFKGRVITEGKIINPDFKKHVKQILNSQSNYYYTNPEIFDNTAAYSNYRIIDTCREFELNGKPISEVIIKPDMFTLIKKYQNGIITNEFTYAEQYFKTKEYDAKGKLLSFTTTYYKKTKTVVIYQNGKTIKNEYKYNAERYDYLPVKKFNKYYYQDGKSYQYSEIDPKTNMEISSGYYEHASGDKYDRKFKYNSKRKLLEEKSTFSNKIKKLKDEHIIKNTYDQDGHLILSKEKCGKQHIIFNCRNIKLNYNVKTSTVTYFADDLNAIINIKPKGIQIQHWTTNGDSFMLLGKENEVYNLTFKNGKKLKSRHRVNADFQYPLRYNDSNDASSFINSLLFQGGLNSNDLFLHETYWNEREDYGLLKYKFTDTFFNSSGMDSAVVIHSGDTLIRMIRINGKYELDYQSFFVRIAKDFHQCAVGIKSLMDKWIAPAKYTEISYEGEDKDRNYFGRNGNYTDIYNWKGELIGENLFGLTYQYSPYFHNTGMVPKSIRLFDAKLESQQILYYVKNDSLKLYRLIYPNGKVAIEFPADFYAVNEYNNNAFKKMLFFSDTAIGKGAMFNFGGRISDYKYDWVRYQDSGIYRVSENGQSYLIDEDFKTILTEPFENLIRSSDSLYLLINSGNVVTPFNPITRSKITQTLSYKISTDQYQQNFLDITDFTSKYHGIANNDLSIRIQPEYFHIYKYHNGFIGKKTGQYDQFDKDGHLIQSIKADTLYNLSQHFNDDNSAYINTFPLIYKNGNFYGLTDREFRTVLEAKYNNILFCESFWMFCNETDTTYCGFDYKVLDNPFPLNKYIYFYSLSEGFNQPQTRFYYDNDRHFYQPQYGLMNNKGQIVSFPVNISGNTYDRFNLSLIYYNNIPQYLIDIEGSIKKDLRNYKRFNEYGDDFYCQNQEELSGVMGRNGENIVSPEHQFLAYDNINQLVWFNCLPGQMLLYNHAGNNNIWQVKSIKSGKICKDTFELPTHFLSGKCLLKNNHGLYGVIDTNLNKVIPFEFTKLYELGQYIGFIKADSILITDYNFKKIKTLNLTVMNYQEKAFWGFHHGQSYLFDSAFNAIDSSKNNFSNSDVWLPIDEDIKSSTMKTHLRTEAIKKEGSIYEEENEDVKDSDDEQIVPKFLGNKKINNTLATLFHYNLRRNLYNNYSTFSYFPYPTYENHYYDHYDFNIKDFTGYSVSMPFVLDLKAPNTYTPNYIKIDQFLDNLITVTNYTDHFITFEYNDHPYEESNQIQNLYVDDVLGFAYINLYDLIDINKSDEFNKILYKKLSTLDDPGIPCYPKTNYMDMFNNKFVITSKGFTFYMNNSTYRFNIDIKELKPCFKDYWKNKF
ncbi:MAG TPA: WG repeat-containing protein [Bacteroidia bacterium]